MDGKKGHAYENDFLFSCYTFVLFYEGKSRLHDHFIIDKWYKRHNQHKMGIFFYIFMLCLSFVQNRIWSNNGKKSKCFWLKKETMNLFPNITVAVNIFRKLKRCQSQCRNLLASIFFLKSSNQQTFVIRDHLTITEGCFGAFLNQLHTYLRKDIFST